MYCLICWNQGSGQLKGIALSFPSSVPEEETDEKFEGYRPTRVGGGSGASNHNNNRRHNNNYNNNSGRQSYGHRNEFSQFRGRSDVNQGRSESRGGKRDFDRFELDDDQPYIGRR